MLIKVCAEWRISLKSTSAEFELRWVTWLGDALSVSCEMLEAWIWTLIKLKKENMSDFDLTLDLQYILDHYYTILRSNEIMRRIAELNSYGQYESKTCIDWVVKCDKMYQKMQRVQANDGRCPSIRRRVTVTDDDDEDRIECGRLRAIFQEIEELDTIFSERMPVPDEERETLTFDPYDFVSEIADNLAIDLLEEFGPDGSQYTNMEMYRFDYK